MEYIGSFMMIWITILYLLGVIAILITDIQYDIQRENKGLPIGRYHFWEIALKYGEHLDE